MPNLNKVFLMGHLTRDPELRYLPNGDPVCNFGMATNRIYYDADGDKQEEVCYVDIVAWQNTAENVSNYLSKGSPALVEGRLQYRRWETKEGDKRSKLEVVAQRVQFLGSKRDDDTQDEDADDDIPF